MSQSSNLWFKLRDLNAMSQWWPIYSIESSLLDAYFSAWA